LSTTAAQFAVNTLKYLAYRVNPPDSFRLTDFRFTDAEYVRLQQLAHVYNSTDPDLIAFRAHGGKIILYHGWADQTVPPFGTVAYYRAMADATPGYRSFARLYMIPAQYHCLAGGDPQVTGNLLSPLMKWVQGGAAPSTVTFPAVTKGSRVTVAPFDPYRQVTGSGRNANYHWIGHFS
jgi:feruloyl esterase